MFYVLAFAYNSKKVHFMYKNSKIVWENVTILHHIILDVEHLPGQKHEKNHTFTQALEL